VDRKKQAIIDVKNVAKAKVDEKTMDWYKILGAQKYLFEFQIY
jgi:hypothetical protein